MVVKVRYGSYSERITDEITGSNLLYPYGFIRSDLTQNVGVIDEPPIVGVKSIVMELPADPDVSIYFY